MVLNPPNSQARFSPRSLHFPKARRIPILSKTCRPSLYHFIVFTSWSVGLMLTLHPCPWRLRSNILNSPFSQSSLQCARVTNRALIQTLSASSLQGPCHKGCHILCQPMGQSTFISKLDNFTNDPETCLTLITPLTMELGNKMVLWCLIVKLTC